MDITSACAHAIIRPLPPAMRDAARLLLNERISRRTFVSRLAQAGVATSAATALGQSLSAAAPPQAGVNPGRVVENLTGGELMAECLLEWNVPVLLRHRRLRGDRLSRRARRSHAACNTCKVLHEGSVMSMADGYARASGQTAFVNVHAVAGTAYALGPMVERVQGPRAGRHHRRQPEHQSAGATMPFWRPTTSS